MESFDFIPSSHGNADSDLEHPGPDKSLQMILTDNGLVGCRGAGPWWCVPDSDSGLLIDSDSGSDSDSDSGSDDTLPSPDQTIKR